MTDKIKSGIFGEQCAADHLKAKGFKILQRNYRYKHSEIDLIVKKDDWLVFVEVKTRSSIAFGYPEEFVDREQAQAIFKAADHYVYEQDWQGNVRYDIVSVLIGNDAPEVIHIEDAFY